MPHSPQARPAADGGQAHPLLRARDSVMEAERLRRAGKLDRARSICVGLLKDFPDYVAALQTVGLVLCDQGRYDEALGYLHRASLLNPRDHNILTALSGAYLTLGFHLAATRTLEQARQLAPADANILATLGEIYREAKEHELSRQALEAALAIDPSFAAAEIGLALNLLHIGELAPAAALFEKAVRAGSRAINHLYMLGQMPAALVSLDLLPLLDEAVPMARRPVDDEFRAQVAFTRAAALDRAGRHDEAWAEMCFARNHNLTESKREYERFRRRQLTLLDLARNCPTGASTPGASGKPVSLFIVGPSRSGKTSLETLVGTLPGVKRGYENAIVESSVRLAFQNGGLPTRSSLIELPPGLSHLFQGFYRAELEERAGSAKVLTNTVPGRNDDALRVAAELPDARFVFLKRDIDDITIRIFMRNYKSGNYYASDIADIREYVSWCHTMIDVMAEKLPGVSRVLTYEGMVADPAAAVAQVAELCGLEAPGVPLPAIGDDRGCAAPYRDRIKAALRTA